jgi:hypothetical protein
MHPVPFDVEAPESAALLFPLGQFTEARFVLASKPERGGGAAAIARE